MIYPESFSCYYADHTSDRAIKILGLNPNIKSKLVKNGQISLYTKKCGKLDSQIFETIYCDYFGWDGEGKPCEYARLNKN